MTDIRPGRRAGFCCFGVFFMAVLLSESHRDALRGLPRSIPPAAEPYEKPSAGRGARRTGGPTGFSLTSSLAVPAERVFRKVSIGIRSQRRRLSRCLFNSDSDSLSPVSEGAESCTWLEDGGSGSRKAESRTSSRRIGSAGGKSSVSPESKSPDTNA